MLSTMAIQLGDVVSLFRGMQLRGGLSRPLHWNARIDCLCLVEYLVRVITSRHDGQMGKAPVQSGRSGASNSWLGALTFAIPKTGPGK